jgi:hypothetical protein
MVKTLISFLIISAGLVAVFLFLTIQLDKKFSRDGRGMLSGLLVGKDNRLSLSKFQVVLWTLVAVISFIALKMANVVCQVPISTEIPPNLLALLGINGATAVLAKGITSYNTGKGNLKTAAASASLSDLYLGDDKAYTDVMKFQMLCWTAVAVAVYFINFVSQCGTAPQMGFPDIDSTLIYLMIIGHGVYLGDKALDSNKPRISGVIPLKISCGEPFSVTGNFVEGSTTFSLNRSIPLEILGWDTSAGGTASARLLMPPCKITSSPAALTATTGGMITDPFYVDIDLSGDAGGDKGVLLAGESGLSG